MVFPQQDGGEKGSATGIRPDNVNFFQIAINDFGSFGELFYLISYLGHLLLAGQ